MVSRSSFIHQNELTATNEWSRTENISTIIHCGSVTSGRLKRSVSELVPTNQILASEYKTIWIQYMVLDVE